MKALVKGGSLLVALTLTVCYATADTVTATSRDSAASEHAFLKGVNTLAGNISSTFATPKTYSVTAGGSPFGLDLRFDPSDRARPARTNPVSPVPEPASLILLGSGLLLVGIRGYMKR